VEIFGQRHTLNQHFSYGRVQRLWLRVNSGRHRGRAKLTFSNPHPEVLAFGSPSLRLASPEPTTGPEPEPTRFPAFFPVGIFAATLEGLPEIRAAGFNTVQSYDSRPDVLRQMTTATAKLGLKFLPNFRRYDPNLSRQLGAAPALLGFYIEDEPEGRSVRPDSLVSLKQRLKQDHPGVLTAVAMLRPQMVREYRHACDVFLLDPYPVPDMPLTWLADCLEEASRHVDRERLWAVVQAFGGGKYVKDGWARRPTYLEMRCLTFLAIVHGAHGVFYFSYPEARADQATWEGLVKIVRQLRELRTWLVLPNEPNNLKLEMLSPFKTDAAGRPAVHYCLKRKGTEGLLILVNAIDRPVEFILEGFSSKPPWLAEVFYKTKAVILDGNIRGNLGPYEVCVYQFRQGS